jgi:tRNA pseudouridine38-40 synthase
MIKRYFIDITYKGENYCGWQIQPNGISIQAILETKLSLILQENIKIIGASRTDAKVNARQMIAHFDTYKNINTHYFLYRINLFTPKDISINDIYQVKNYIHARYDAINRTYKYIISIKKNPFNIELAWLVMNKQICIKKLNISSKMISSIKYFDLFCKKHKKEMNTKCVIKTAYWVKYKSYFIFTITSNRFMRNMVRAIVGLSLDVGRNKITLLELENIIKNNKKNKINSAPPQGLFLHKITYPYNIYRKIYDIY